MTHDTYESYYIYLIYIYVYIIYIYMYDTCMIHVTRPEVADTMHSRGNQ